ncbi:hypothetical protein BO79DRAFT_66466 [Aspergillus costaricaensis CBS 115574]|uniref:Uncharacterized protein n=1 Tax=Aspergillus costaricaensis CBS 115574 TaxID=1448317 RepID=A0ACD1HZE2_9EURO|nr:hypothetical protein BO79DRAFT_66466 [Aspergillus costaricaensis CBS 115574]RAK83685.1 hypothetical protein BO79DRAFT_66466 [Aspergillus costaricaensis CBS 115574]
MIRSRRSLVTVLRHISSSRRMDLRSLMPPRHWSLTPTMSRFVGCCCCCCCCCCLLVLFASLTYSPYRR